MKSILRKKNKSSLRNKQYLFYALGEILLIIIGILIAVNIDQWIKNSKDNELRCLYLEELLYTFDHDIKDVKGNIGGLDKWNPMIRDLKEGLVKNKLEEVDSLDIKFGTVGNFVIFGQRSKTKIEELKFSSINLISNRELKNRVLMYQDNNINFIRMLEKKYELVGEDLRRYYTMNFKGFNYQPAFPIDIEKIKKDNVYHSLVSQRLEMNYALKKHYEQLLEEQNEIYRLLTDEIKKNCN